MKRIIAVLSVLWLAGCSTPTTPEELRSAVDPEVLSSLKNYQELYATVEQRVRTCYSGANTMRSALYVDEGRGATVHVEEIHAVGHQTARHGVSRACEYCRYTALEREFYGSASVSTDRRVSKDNKTVWALHPHPGKSSVKILSVFDL